MVDTTSELASTIEHDGTTTLEIERAMPSIPLKLRFATSSG